MDRWNPVPDGWLLYSLVQILSFSKLITPIYVAMLFMERFLLNFADMRILGVS